VRRRGFAFCEEGRREGGLRGKGSREREKLLTYRE